MNIIIYLLSIILSLSYIYIEAFLGNIIDHLIVYVIIFIIVISKRFKIIIITIIIYIYYNYCSFELL